jgi:glycosyltransferase involved in cell wall biosynthesis
VSDKSERVLVLIPAYNEQATIKEVVGGAQGAVPHADVLVIDDGSVDNTAQEAESAGAFVVRHPFNLGIGGAVQTGLKFAQRGDYDAVIRLDGDGQHNPSDIPKLHAILQTDHIDVVIGSRFLDTTRNMQIPFLRWLGICTFAALVSLLTGRRATDTTSGFSAMNRRAVDALVTYMPQDYPEVESRIVLHKAGLKTLELPARMNARLSGVSSINSWRSIYYALKVSVAVLIGSLKDIPTLPQEVTHADTD